MRLVIRPATAADAPAMTAMFTALNRHEDTISHDRRTDPDGGAETMRVALARVAETRGHALVAERDGEVAGCLLLEFRTDAVFVRPELRPHAYVSDLFVDPAQRGQGIGAALMREAERLAMARGMSRIGVGVLAGNTLAESLYARVGYSPYAVELLKTLPSDADPAP